MIIALIGRKTGSKDSVHKNIQEILISFARKIFERGHVVMFDEDTLINFIVNTPFMDDYTAEVKVGSFKCVSKTADIAIVLGGDGTMLNTAKALSANDIPILGINLGRVGFITDMPVDFDHDKIITMLEKVEYTTEKRHMIKISESAIIDKIALNDVVITRNTGKILEFNVIIDDEHAYTARGDGLMISTPTGSTAYAMSANGPIIHPTARVIEVLPILPQSLSCRPLIINDTSSVKFELISGEADVYVDGQLHKKLKPTEDLEVMRSERKVEFIHPRMKDFSYNYFSMLSEKLNWHLLPGTLRV